MPIKILVTVAAAAVLAAAAGAETAPQPAPIVYATGSSGPSANRSDLYVRDTDGSVRRLSRTSRYEGFPSWSPDGSQIVFVAAPKGDSDVYVMNADGTGVRRLAGSARRANDLYPAWSPDGRLIAFTSNRDGVENELYVMRADGTGLRRLTRTPDWVDDTAPRFSPDGRYLVFSSNRVSFFNYELFRIRVSDGRGLTRLTFWGSGKDGAPGDDLLPDYSPDGTRIAFVSDRRGGYAIWVMNANGKDLREVTRHPRLNVVFPRFSPDGRSLLYTTFDPRARTPVFRLWTVRVDGSNRTLVGRGSEADW